MKKLILVILLTIGSIANDYIDYNSGSSFNDNSYFGNTNSDMYGLTYLYNWSNLSTFPNTSGVKLSNSYMRGDNFRFSHSGYFGWEGAFGGNSIKALEYIFDSQYVFPITKFFNPYFGLGVGAGVRFNDPFLLSQSNDWLIKIWQNFFVTKLEVGTTASITKTLNINISYSKSFTFELADSVNIGLIFKLPR